MEQPNGCFDHHEDMYPPISVSESEHDCLKDFLLEPPIPPISEEVTSLPNYHPPVVSNDNSAGNQPVAFQSPGQSVESTEKNGECWSPQNSNTPGRTDAGGSERTVSSDCVSSETVYSPETEFVEASSSGDQGSKRKSSSSGSENRGRKRKSGDGTRGRPSRQKNVTTYQSQISPDQNGIKLKIKKNITSYAPQKSRKKRSKGHDDDYEEPLEQSVWGDHLPEEILCDIFYMVTKSEEGCLPFLVR